MAIPATTSVPLSGYSGIDGLLSGGMWFSSGGPLTLTWGTADNPYQGYDIADPRRAALELRPVLQQWSDVANIQFSYAGHFADFTTARADIAVSLSDNTILFDVVAVGIFPLRSVGDLVLDSLGWNRAVWPQPEGDVFVNVDASFDGDNYEFYVAHHELGHALGLKHPHDGGAVGNPTFAKLGIGALDDTYNTAMSYNGNDGLGAGLYPTTPMPLDILAVQYLYGANFSHRTGNDTYVLGETGSMQTIWDAGGRDIFDASTSTGPVTIDLNDYDGFGSGYSFHGSTSVTAIAVGVVIENAIGSRFADVIIGNEVGNRIRGAAGNDEISGGAGNDALFGGAGDDRLFGGIGADRLVGQDSNDLLSGGRGNDRLFGGVGNDRLFGSFGTDILVGHGGNDLLHGGASSDRLFGGADGDRLIGGRGNDRLVGGGGDDLLLGMLDRDVLLGKAGADTFLFRNVLESVAGADRDRIQDFSSAEGDRIHLRRIDADESTGPDDAFTFIGTAAFSATPGELRYVVNPLGHAIVRADVDGNATSDFEIRVANTDLLTADDFVL